MNHKVASSRVLVAITVLAVTQVTGCSNGAEGVIRWSYRSCTRVTDAGVNPMPDDGGAEAGAPVMPSCDPAHSNVANTASPVPRPNPQVLRCFSRVTGAAPMQTVTVGFIAKDASGARFELRGMGGTLAATATTVGTAVSSCEVVITDGELTGIGQCGMGCTVMINSVDMNAGTIIGSIRCTEIPGPGMDRFWTVRNAEGVPSMAADFSVSKCEAAP